MDEHEITVSYFEIIDKIVSIIESLYGKNYAEKYVGDYINENFENRKFYQDINKLIGEKISFVEVDEIVDNFINGSEYIGKDLREAIISITANDQYINDYINDYIEEEKYSENFRESVRLAVREIYGDDNDVYKEFIDQLDGELSDEFKNIILAIREQTLHDEFLKYVGLWLSIYKITTEQYKKSLTKIIETMYECDCKEWIYSLILELTKNNPEETERPTISQIFTLALDTEVIFFIEDSIEISYMDLIMGMFKMYDDDEMSEACQNIDLIITFESENDRRNLNILINKLDSENEKIGNPNTILRKYLVDKLGEISEYAPIPDWIIHADHFPDDVIPTHQMLLELLPEIHPKKYKSVNVKSDVRLIIDQATKQLGDEIAGVERMEEKLRIELEKLSPEERTFEINKYYKNQTEMLSSMHNVIFRVLGASFPISGGHDLDTNSNDPCLKYGGCRAMTCYENENLDEDTNLAIVEDITEPGALEKIDWFTGVCLVCNRKIRARHHAVRKPMKEGGWKDCYCSWEHVKDDIYFDKEVDPNALHLVDGFEKLYVETGIYERRWE